MDYFNTIHSEQVYPGVELDNLRDTLKHLTFKVVTVSEVPNMSRLGPKGLNFQRKILKFKWSHNREHFTIEIFAIYASLIAQLGEFN